MRSSRLLALALLASACSGPAAMNGDGGDAGAPPDFAPPPDLAPPPDMTIAQPILPQVADHGGPKLTKVNLVTITFNNYRWTNVAQAWGDLVVGSNWYKTVGADYGVGAGVHLKKVVFPDDPGTGITEKQVIAMIDGHIKDGTLPPPPANLGQNQNLYMIYFPSTTTVNEMDGSAACSSFAGFHADAAYSGGGRFAYAVIADCGGSQDDITSTASHELIEAATDPFPFSNAGYFVEPDDPTDPWAVEYGQEVGDLCEFESTYVYEGGFAMQRIWSNTSAMNFTNPCIPADKPMDYTTVTAIPADIQSVAAGQKVQYVLTGWAPMLEPAWTIKIADANYSAYAATDLQAQLSKTTIGRGQSVILTLKAPANAQSGDLCGVEINSTSDQHRQVVAFTVQ